MIATSAPELPRPKKLLLHDELVLLGAAMKGTSSSDIHEFVKEVTKHVVVDNDTLQVIVDRRAIRKTLLGSAYDAGIGFALNY